MGNNLRLYLLKKADIDILGITGTKKKAGRINELENEYVLFSKKLRS